MDEQEREQIKAELRAELLEEQRKNRLDSSFAPVVQSANREQSWERQGAQTGRPLRESAASILGAVLAEQMIAGMSGTTLEADGLGDGTA